jgi:hypothetical protein
MSTGGRQLLSGEYACGNPDRHHPGFATGLHILGSIAKMKSPALTVAHQV